MQKRNIMYVSVLAVVVGISGITASYAYEELVTLPRSDYTKGPDCFAVVMPGSPIWVWDCQWTFEENYPFVKDADPGLITIDPTVDEPIEEFLRELKSFLDSPGNQLGLSDDLEVDVTTGKTPLSPEEEEALSKLDKCLHGTGAWMAFVPEQDIPFYENKTRGEFTIRDNLSKNVSMLNILKAIEVCDASREYVFRGFIGAEEVNKAIADQLGVDYKGRPATIIGGLDMSENFAPEKTADASEIEEQARLAAEYMCSTSGKQRGLCGGEFDGVNRGGVVGEASDSVYNQFSGKSGKQIIQEYLSKKAADEFTDQDAQNIETRNNRIACEIEWKASAGYGAISVNKWRLMLQEGGMCDSLLTEEFMLLTTGGDFSTLEDARNYRVELDAQLMAERQSGRP